ncbi:hypothetical protein AAY473_013702 [Plecturocebus cupreus]
MVAQLLWLSLTSDHFLANLGPLQIGENQRFLRRLLWSLALLPRLECSEGSQLIATSASQVQKGTIITGDTLAWSCYRVLRIGTSLGTDSSQTNGPQESVLSSCQYVLKPASISKK